LIDSSKKREDPKNPEIKSPVSTSRSTISQVVHRKKKLSRKVFKERAIGGKRICSGEKILG